MMGLYNVPIQRSTKEILAWTRLCWGLAVSGINTVLLKLDINLSSLLSLNQSSMRLIESDGDLIAAIGFNGDKSCKQISELIGVREHVVRNGIDKLCDGGIIYPQSFINPFRLGVTEYQVFFSLDNATERDIAKFIKTLQDNEHVAWMWSLGGEFNFSIGIYARHSRDVYDVFDSIGRACPNMKYEKQISVTVGMNYFNAQYLSSNTALRQSLRFPATESKFKLDKVDHLILKSLIEDGYLNFSSTARKLGMPVTTLNSRVKNLKDNDVLLALGYLVRYYTVPFHPFLFLLKLQKPSATFDEELFHFVQSVPNVTFLMSNIGNWDYRLFAHIASPQDVIPFVQKFKDRFPDRFSRITPVPVLEMLKKKRYPFRNFSD
jgi:DNA-binding Lrp family transcriptional regulator